MQEWHISSGHLKEESQLQHLTLKKYDDQGFVVVDDQINNENC